MRKISGLLMLVLVLCLAVPAFSFSGGKLSNAMNSAAVAGQYLNEIMHPGMPKPWTNPMYGTMMDNLSKAWVEIDREIASIETPKDIENARAIVNNFKSLTGTFRDLGHQVEIALEKRIKFLEVHGS